MAASNRDVIQIQDIRIDALIGIYPHERKRRQPVWVSLEFPCDVAKAARRDQIEDAVDYDRLTREAVAFGRQSAYFLIETLADRMAARLLEASDLPWIRLSLLKPRALKSARGVRITVCRRRRRSKNSKD